MTEPFDNPTDEATRQRLRWGGFWLMVGCFFLLASGIVYYQRSASMDTGIPRPQRVVEGPSTQTRPSPPDGAAVIAKHQRIRDFLNNWLLSASLLLLIFMVGAYALRRWSRSYRAMLVRRPARPTPTPDIWSMHEVPPELERPPGDEDESG